MDFKLGDQVMLKVDDSLPMGTAGKVIQWGQAPRGKHFYRVLFYGMDRYPVYYNIPEKAMDRIFVRLKRIPEELEMHFPKTYLK